MFYTVLGKMLFWGLWSKVTRIWVIYLQDSDFGSLWKVSLLKEKWTKNGSFHLPGIQAFVQHTLWYIYMTTNKPENIHYIHILKKSCTFELSKMSFSKNERSWPTAMLVVDIGRKLQIDNRVPDSNLAKHQEFWPSTFNLHHQPSTNPYHQPTISPTINLQPTLPSTFNQPLHFLQRMAPSSPRTGTL